jgi:hypothetical protein
MFDWENRLKELSDYDIGFEIKQGYYHISIVFDEKWEVLEPDNESIYVEKRNGVYHYIAPSDSVTIAEMFKTVDATIEYNMDLQKKLILFKKKTEELQEIFAKETLEVLETIEFKYGLKKEMVTFYQAGEITEDELISSLKQNETAVILKVDETGYKINGVISNDSVIKTSEVSSITDFVYGSAT